MRTKRTLPVLMMTEDRRLLDLELPVWKGVVVSESTQEAWVLIDALVPLWDGKPGLIVSERDTAPILLNGATKKSQEEVRKLVNQVGREARRDAHFRNDRDQKSRFLNNFMQIGILALILLIIIVVLWGMITNGSLKTPF